MNFSISVRDVQTFNFPNKIPLTKRHTEVWDPLGGCLAIYFCFLQPAFDSFHIKT